MPALVDRGRLDIKLNGYGTAPAAALADPALHPRVQDYRRQASTRMVALEPRDIRTRVPAAPYHVSRKVDGEFTVLVYRDGQALSLNPGGTVRVGLPWMDEAAGLLSQAGVREALVAGELYVERPGVTQSTGCPGAPAGRPRVHDVTSTARQPTSLEDLQNLRFAVFDLVSLEGKSPGENFADTWKQIERIFAKGRLVHPVQAEFVKDVDGIERLLHQWVEVEGAEGLVARSDTAGTFKIKLRQTLDAAVIGFTEATDERQGLLHDLLVAVMRGDETLQVLTRVGGGFSDDQRRTMLSDLKDMAAQSEYAEVNSDHVAYQMVEPQWVVEISCLDLISQTVGGGPIMRMALDWDRAARAYSVVRRLPLASVISPQFVRLRDDKTVSPADVRIRQVTDLVEVPLADRDARQVVLPASVVLRREVYTKQMKGETMVRKFVLWKTNKELQSEDYPAFVVHFTDFSPNRKTALERELRVSNSREQIDLLWEGLKSNNLAKGWELRGEPSIAAALEITAPAAGTAEQAPLEAAAPKMAPSERTKRAKTKKAQEPAVPSEAAQAPAEEAPPKMAPSERTTTKPAKKKKTG
jgi:hypothetical protein